MVYINGNETETETRTRYINPALLSAGWVFDPYVREEYVFTDGQILVRGTSHARGDRKKADYLLLHGTDTPVAVLEAKKTGLDVSTGIQQAIDYAEILDVPFAYSSNGKGFREHDRITGKERSLDINDFPSMEELWQRFISEKKMSEKQVSVMEQKWYYADHDPKLPRYYQRVAVDSTLDAIARGQKRILLVMATGTGKTFAAFQIVHRLRSAGMAKKVLYLADRNVLIDQTILNDFKPFKKILTKIKHKKLDPAYDIYMALYQQMVDNDGNFTFTDVKPSFFDLIIVDECHRGSAREDSQWRAVLDYFSDAVQIGMTATPKETKDVSNIGYFGDPVYTYSLKTGIEDGFLAPYKVVRVHLDIDETGYTPKPGELDLNGEPLEDRTYGAEDFDKKIIVHERRKTVAEKITEYVRHIDPYGKAIIFCETIEHAQAMRDLLAQMNPDQMKLDPRYVIKITGDDGAGKKQLDNFIEPTSKYPVIATTSELLSTGVDCKTCRLIVLDKRVESIGKFKQIIGRGTRIHEDENKYYFTILDFRDDTRLFSDPEFDGEPVEIYDPDEHGHPYPPEPPKPDGDRSGEPEPIPPGPRVVYKVNGSPVYVMQEIVSYYDKNGKLITENIKDYTKRGVGEKYRSMREFLSDWNSGRRHEEILAELERQGVLLEELRKTDNGKQYDDFDLICHIAFDAKPLTKAERINNVKKRGAIYKYAGDAKNIIDALLDHYAKTDIEEIEDRNILTLDEFQRFGSVQEIARKFGGKQGWDEFISELTKEIYGTSA